MKPRSRSTTAVTEDQLNHELEDLPGWEPWEDTTPREYPKSRQELRKNFVFSSFEVHGPGEIDIRAHVMR